MLIPFFVHAQNKPKKLFIEVKGKDADFIKKNIPVSFAFTDSIRINQQLNSILLKCSELSFLQAEFSELKCENDSCRTNLFPGKSFKWMKLSKGNVPTEFLSVAGFREEQFHSKIFDLKQFSKRAERMLLFLENEGFPFASLKLDSINADSNGISASLNLNKGNFTYFDSIDLRGTANIKRWYIEKYLGIKKGNPYNELLIKNADSRLSQLSFVKTQRNSAIIFYGAKARPVVFLENRKVSSIDGIIGFAPKTQQNTQLSITGEANLKLQNLFGSGKSVDVNYRSFSTSSQDLKFRFQYPYIFLTNLTLDYQLGLLKFDTLYLDVVNEFALQYRFIGTDYFKVFYSLQTTSLITVDTNQIKASHALPQNSDLRYDQYGIGFHKTKYDYFLNPRKGYSIDFSAGVGMKQIVENSTIKNLKLYDNSGNGYSIYDTIKMQYVQYKFSLNADYYLPISTRITFRTQTMAAHIEADNIFFNELFRIGGIKTLKGFDEQSIFASSYAIVNTELRYLLQQNSNFMLFWNGAWYRNVVRIPRVSDKPFGFGAGMNFETGAGVFSIFYAVGSQFNNAVNYNQAKIHFGFVNYF